MSDPERWGQVSRDLDATLQFLTGDRWELRFDRRKADPFRSDRRPRAVTLRGVASVQLFSGGLDSFAGAVSRLLCFGDHLYLIGHQDQPGAAAAQARLAERIDVDARFRGRTTLRTIRLAPGGPGPRELSSRSRSLVFIALALYAVRSLGLEVPVTVPENGFIAMNVPLTLARIGSSSTRTTHPHFLESLQRIWQQVGIDQGIANPLSLMTKGEALAHCGDLRFLLAAAQDSVSCAHASRRMHWVRREARNCGYCWPCLIRRAAMHHIGADAGAAYGLDVLHGELPLERESAADLRALLSFLCEVRTDRQIRQRMLLSGPLGRERSLYIDVVRRGLEEIRCWISTGDARLRRLAGV